MGKDMLPNVAEQVAIKRNRFPKRSCQLTALPFIVDVKVAPRRTERDFWHVPEVDCYATANVIGAQFAADWIQFLKENPSEAGTNLMGRFASEMYVRGRGDGKSHGIAVGFWCLIETALLHAGIDHYACAEDMAQRIAAHLQD